LIRLRDRAIDLVSRVPARVQYIGYRFDPEAFMADLLSLVDVP
jgi:hypothetical protein